MAKLGNTPQRFDPPSPEEVQAKARQFAENALFAGLGAICALVVGIGLFGDFKTPFFQDRSPASVSTTTPEIVVDER